MNMSRKLMNHSKAFSLIELIITVAIVSIIAAIAIPSYQEYITRTKRADAMGQMLNAISAMEKFRAANMTYEGAAAGTTFAAQVPPGDGNPYYNLTLSNLSRTTYTITATPVNSMAGEDGPLTVDQAGRRTWTDDGGTSHNCWPESGNSC